MHREIIVQGKGRAGRGHRSDGGDEAAVYADDAAGDVAGPWTGEEGDDVGILPRVAVAAERDRGNTFGCDLSYWSPLTCRLGLVELHHAARRDSARDDNVAGDVALAS